MCWRAWVLPRLPHIHTSPHTSCTGMWVAGWQVTATKQTPMEHDHQEGGTHRPQTVERCWGKQQGIAGQVMAVSGAW